MKLIKRIMQHEAGVVLPLALIILLFGGLMIIPLLMLMDTSLNANRMVDDNTLELYGADAGVEYALWSVQYDTALTLPAEGDDPLSLAFPETINGRTVSVTISNEGADGYKVTSTATSNDGNSTTVESYFAPSLDFGWLFDSAISSPGDVTIMPGSDVTGDVTCGGDLDNHGDIDGDELTELGGAWPTATDMIYFYMQQVADLGLTPYPDSSIDISSGTEGSPDRPQSRRRQSGRRGLRQIEQPASAAP